MANEDVITTSGIIGSDGFSPIYNPNDSYHLWNWDEIFFGTDSDSPGKNRYVPKIDDGVMKKCTLCIDRIYNQNLPEPERVPACVSTCPASARHFGDFNDPDGNTFFLSSR